MKVAVIDRKLFAHSYLPLFREISTGMRKGETYFFYSHRECKPLVGLGRTVIKRVWTSSLYPFQIVKSAMDDRLDLIHIQFEFGTFGPLFTSLLFPFLLVFLKIARIRVVVTVHGIFPISMAKEILGSERSYPAAVILKIALISMHKLIEMFSDALIVHSAYMKRIFLSDYRVKKETVVIPHGFEFTKKDLSRTNHWVNQYLRGRLLLFFGYIAPAKRCRLSD